MSYTIHTDRAMNLPAGAETSFICKDFDTLIVSCIVEHVVRIWFDSTVLPIVWYGKGSKEWTNLPKDTYRVAITNLNTSSPADVHIAFWTET
jgi:hypothetical protein